jgi:acyl carrier protein
MIANGDAAAAVRRFVLERVHLSLSAVGLTPETTPDDYDLLASGVIDSFGIIELIADIEERFDVALEFDDVEPDVVTVVGPLSRYVAGLIEQRQ